MFWSKPSGGPDVIGGLAPVDFPEVKMINRSGGTHTKGEVVMCPFNAGVATEIATNDSNSYKPGFSNDTVWNTVVDPTTNATKGGSTLRQMSFFGVCMSDSVADNTIGSYKFFGVIEQAFCVGAGPTRPGQPLSVSITNSFKGAIGTNEVCVAMYLDKQSTNTARGLRRVMLHNGMMPVPLGGITANT